MIYLDYSATTPVNKDVLDTFNKVSLEYIGNPNSLHELGSKAKQLIDAATKQIADILGVKETEIIYTSGSSESNNTVIKQVALKYQNRGKHIITTSLEHSSIIAPLSYLQNLGFEVETVKLLDNGLVDIEHLKQIIREDTILVSINAVDSELGVRQNIEEIGLLLKNYPKCFFHSDITQCIGKDKIDLTNIDFASFSAHKFYGLKGIGCLIKKEKIAIEPLIMGGKSTTIYRSGTPSVALTASLAKALRLINSNIDKNYDYVKNLNKRIIEKISQYNDVYINSTDKSIPHIINFSIIGIKSETFMHALEKYGIYVSTKTACSTSDISSSVYSLTKDNERSISSLRISLSYLTTEEEINKFLEAFDICYKELVHNENN
jgi:cysteine desulfurase